MSTCEKCWSDAHLMGGGESVADNYSRLIHQRKGAPCSPEQQAGEGAKKCAECGRAAVHVYTGECMACGVSLAEEGR